MLAASLNKVDVISYHSTPLISETTSPLSSDRVLAFGILGGMWKKQHILTVIKYKDNSSDKEVVVFDFENGLQKVNNH